MIPWLQTVRELGSLGFTLTSEYKRTVRLSWNDVQEKLRKVAITWSARILPTLRQRVEVVHTFLTSLVWYKAQVLPIPKGIAKEMDSIINKFVWTGSIESIPLSLCKQERKKGGLSLVDVRMKGRALLIKNTLNLLGQENELLKYWLQISLRNICPWLKSGLRAESMTEHYKNLTDYIKTEFEGQKLTKEEAMGFKAKNIYKEMEQEYPVPRAQTRMELDEEKWKIIWKRIENKVHDMDAQDILYRTIHQIIPTRYRIHRIGRAPFPFCPDCTIKKGPVEGPLLERGRRGDLDLVVGGPIGDIVHVLAECKTVEILWSWFRKLVLRQMDKSWGKMSNKEIIFLIFPKFKNEETVLWMISTYIYYIYIEVFRRRRKPRLEQLIATFELKHLAHVSSKRVALKSVDFKEGLS